MGRPGRWGHRRHRFDTAQGTPGTPPAGPRVQRAAGQHRDPSGEGSRVRRHRYGRRRPGPPGNRTRRRGPPGSGDPATPGGPGRSGRRVPDPRRRNLRPAGGRRGCCGPSNRRRREGIPRRAGGWLQPPDRSHAVLDGDEVLLAGAISSPDGAVLLRGEQRSADGPDLGRALARHLLDERGGSALLESA